MNETSPKIQEFLEKYKALVEDLKVDFASYPVFTPDGQGGFRVVLQSTPVDLSTLQKPEEKKEEGVPSPFVPEK